MLLLAFLSAFVTFNTKVEATVISMRENTTELHAMRGASSCFLIFYRFLRCAFRRLTLTKFYNDSNPF